jgi:hypothetical protein
MLGLSSGLMYGSPVLGPGVFTYASNWMMSDSEYKLSSEQGWLFNPCSSSDVSVNATGGSRSNDNHVYVAYLSGSLSDSCTTWQGTLLSASELDGGLIDGDVVTFSYEMAIGAANDKWDPGDGSAVSISTTISGFDAVSTNFTPFITYPSYTEVSIEVTKSGGTQDEGLSVNIGPFSAALTGAIVYFRRVNATVNRPD